jgi:N6-adenosine-specific RNA methylase IME4
MTSIDRRELKRAHRAKRERALATATLEASRALGRELYGCILADPPWSFAVYNDDTGQDRGACNHYPTMTLAKIKALPIPAGKDCVLFLWATVPMLPQALEVMAAWNFIYKSNFVWVKDKTGLGFWNRNRHELLLIGTRGAVPCPAPGTQFNSVVEAARGRHSEKPAIVRNMIAKMFPNTPKLEMFARGQRVAGWDFWGNETVPAATTDVVTDARPHEICPEHLLLKRSKGNLSGEELKRRTLKRWVERYRAIRNSGAAAERHQED